MKFGLAQQYTELNHHFERLRSLFTFYFSIIHLSLHESFYKTTFMYLWIHSLVTYLCDKQWSYRLLLTLRINVMCMHDSRPQDSMKQHVYCKKCNIARHGTYTQQIKQEEFSVLSTNAVIHPYTVMVKSLNTSVTHT